MPISDRWNSRFPVSRRKPFSEETQPPDRSEPRTVLKRRPLRRLAASASTSSASAVVLNEACTGSRLRLRGAAGGFARIALKCAQERGTMQPISEMNSRP